MKLIKLTDLSGNPVWVVDTWVQFIRRPNRDYQAEAKSVLVLSGYLQAVQEEPETVVKLLS